LFHFSDWVYEQPDPEKQNKVLELLECVRKWTVKEAEEENAGRQVLDRGHAKDQNTLFVSFRVRERYANHYTPAPYLDGNRNNVLKTSASTSDLQGRERYVVPTKYKKKEQQQQQQHQQRHQLRLREEEEQRERIRRLERGLGDSPSSSSSFGSSSSSGGIDEEVQKGSGVALSSGSSGSTSEGELSGGSGQDGASRAKPSKSYSKFPPR